MKLVTNNLGTWTRCRFCRTNASVNTGRVNPGTIGIHMRPPGVVCDGTDTTVTLEAAIARDDHLTPEERAAKNDVVGEALRCHGYDRDGEPCNHTAKARCRREAEAAAKQQARGVRIAS